MGGELDYLKFWYKTENFLTKQEWKFLCKLEMVERLQGTNFEMQNEYNRETRTMYSGLA